MKIEVQFKPYGYGEKAMAVVSVEPMDDGTPFLRWLMGSAPYYAEAMWVDAEGNEWRKVLRARLNRKIRGRSPDEAISKAKKALLEYHQLSRHSCVRCASLNEGQPLPIKNGEEQPARTFVRQWS